MKFDGWLRKMIGHLFHTTSSFVHHFKSIGASKPKLQSGNTQFGSTKAIFVSCDLEIRRMTLKNYRAPLLCCFKLCASFHSHLWIQTRFTVQKRPIWVKIDGFFLSHVTLKFNRWPWKTIGQLFYTTSSIVHHFKAMGEFKLELQSGTAEFGSKSATSFPCDLEIWQMTLKNNRAPLLDCFKLCASFHRHQCIQTRVVVRKRLIWVKIDDCFSRVTLKFDGWPWKTIGHLS